MENYIVKINKKVVTENDEEKQKKIKRSFLIIGGIVLGLGLAGLVASVITFIVLFFRANTDEALIAWFVAIPFILMIVAGSVLTRIGIMLLNPVLNKQINKKG